MRLPDLRLFMLVACATALLTVVAAAQEEKYELKEYFKEGSIETADSLVELQVDMKVQIDKRESKLPMKFKQVQKYVQKVLKSDGKGKPEKVARHFEKSTMEIRQPGGKPASGSTAYEGKTYIIKKTKDGVEAQMPGGTEVSKEAVAELGVAVNGNLHKLLPGKPVGVGESWEVPVDAIGEVFTIAGKTEGKAKAVFSEVKEHEERRSAIVKIELEMQVPQGSIVLTYKGQGKVYFSLEDKRITDYSFSAKVEVSGSQKSDYGEMKFGGEGTAKSWFKTTPGRGEIDLNPPKDQEPEKNPGSKEEETPGKDIDK